MVARSWVAFLRGMNLGGRRLTNDELGYAVPVFVRAADEVRAIASAAPFTGDQLADRGKPQVIFVMAAPSHNELEDIEALVSEGDVLVPAGRHLHWLPADGSVAAPWTSGVSTC